jgi:erythromycin esterase
VVETKSRTTPAETGFFRADSRGHVDLDLPPGEYDLEVTAPNGFLKRSAISVRGAITLVLEDDCERTDGRAGGDIHAGDFVWFRSASDGAYFGALVTPDGAFAACLPAGAYTLDAHDDERAPSFVVDSGTNLKFDAFVPTAIDATPPSIGHPPLSATIEQLLGPECRVIGIGEANHGTHEFLRVRLRESLSLARKRGVRFIALEAGPAEVFPLDDYIHGRRRDVKVPLSAIGYWMWDTKDMLEILAELRTYNRRVPAASRVSLVGIDVQRSDTAANYLLSAKIPLSDSQRAALDAAARAKELADIAPDTATALLRELLPLTAPQEGATRLPLRTALALEQLIWRLRMHAAPPRSPWAQRDLGMASIVATILRYEESSRIVIWAHNNHVSTDASSAHRPLGSHLRKEFGAGYVSVGLFMGRGTFRAWDADTKVGVVEHTVSEAPPSSLEAALAPHVVGGESFLRLADSVELREWLRIPHRAVMNGGVMPRNNEWPLVRHADAFDIVGLVAEVTPTTPTATGVRRATTP